MDPLMPLTAAVVTKDLEREKRLALTGAALVLKGPLALAPALVAAERARRGQARPTSGGPVGPQLVKVPDMLGKPLEKAEELLKTAELKWTVSENKSSEEEKGTVLRQDPMPSAVDRVEVGSTVHLNIGAGPRKPTGHDDHNRLETKIEDLGQRIGEHSRQLEELRKQGEQLSGALREELQRLGEQLRGQSQEVIEAIKSKK
jgi:hypothetical protein